MVVQRVILVVTLCLAVLLLGGFIWQHSISKNHITASLKGYMHEHLNKVPTVTNEKCSAGCISGHIQNLPPVCGNDGCLRILSIPRVTPQIKPMPAAVKHILRNTEGMFNVRTVDIIYNLTRAQRNFGIWGSVGEIGVYYGRLTQALAYWMDVEAGERLFVCDIFGAERHMFNTERARRDKFEEAMKKVGFSSENIDEAHRIRVFANSSLYLTKAQLVNMALPAFRLISLDANHNLPFPLSDMVTCSCIAQPGAILAMDDVFWPTWPDVGKALNQFFTHYGSNIWRPVLLQHGKMFLVTADWHQRYITWIEHNWQGMDKAPKKTIELNNVNYTYYNL